MKEIYRKNTGGVYSADDTDLKARVYSDNSVVFSDVDRAHQCCLVAQRDLPELINALQRAYELGHDNIQDTSRRSDTQET